MKEFFGDRTSNKSVYLGFDSEARGKSVKPYTLGKDLDRTTLDTAERSVPQDKPRPFVNTIKGGVIYDSSGRRVRGLYR